MSEAPSSQDIFTNAVEDVEMTEIIQPESEFRSGLRSSEIGGSQLSYSGISSFDDTSTVLRPGVNDDIGTVDRSAQNIDHIQNVIYGTDVNVASIVENFRNFILNFKTNVLDENFSSDLVFDPNVSLYIQKLDDMKLLMRSFVNLNCKHLIEDQPQLYRSLVAYPKEVIPAMDSVFDSIYRSRYRDSSDEPIQTRPFNCEESRNLRNLNPEDLDQLVSVNGLVIRMSSIIPEMTKAHFKCSVCNNVQKQPCERGKIVEPNYCTSCHAKYTQVLVHNLCEFTDKQMIKLQESPDDMPTGQTPHTVTLFCHQDLVDTVQPGDRVTVSGIYRAAPQRESSRQRIIKSVFNTYIDVLHFQKSAFKLRDNEENVAITIERIKEITELSKKPDLYERLTTAIAPSIYENENIKKGILLQLFGGLSKAMKLIGGSGDSRGDVNILLCGDPGTSKSQLLQYVFNLTPRSQYTSGRGSSEVGLTAYVTRDPETRNLTLQAGALVLADNGVCCIDEFDKMSESARSVLHEVMEQQSLSIAKAGVICQLNARTSVLAAANPVGSSWNTKKTIIENIQLPPTLLSRFDLIFLMLDPQDEEYDKRLARHLIGLYQGSYSGSADLHDGSISLELMRDYISYAKKNINPVLSEAAGHYLVDEYVEMRKVGNSMKGQVSAYPRQLESLIRLAEAHARMRLSNIVEMEDCQEARRLQKEALKQAAIDPLTGLIDINILTTGVSGGLRRKKEEMADFIWKIIEERQVMNFQYSDLLEKLRNESNRMITRELFEDGLNYLKMENKIHWTGRMIKKR